MDLINEGIKKKLIQISDDKKRIVYLHQDKSRNYLNPEEKVQAMTFLKLVLDYKYKPKRIRLFESVKMGTETKEADIVVYNDDEYAEPFILVECKRQDVSEAEFQQAIEQAYSYAYALPNDIKYIWVTSGIKDEYFEVDKKKKSRTTQTDIPQYGIRKLSNFKYVYDAKNAEQKEEEQKYKDLTVIEQEELTRRFKQAHDALWGGWTTQSIRSF
jgi:type I restriction enzyme M protein